MTTDGIVLLASLFCILLPALFALLVLSFCRAAALGDMIGDGNLADFDHRDHRGGTV